MPESVAICFFLANPRPETRRALLERRLRSFLLQIPFIRGAVEPRWSPRRRLGYGAGLRACVNSLRRRHRSLPHILLLRPEGDPPTLSDVDETVFFDPATYASVPHTSTYFGPEVYYKLEVFNLRGYERIVYLDCDTIVLDDISALWDLESYAEKDLYAVRETAETGSTPAVAGSFNTGVMVINRSLLCDRVHHELIDLASTGEAYDGGDQGVINRYLNETPALAAGELDPSYNVLVLSKKYGQWERFKDRIRILHFVNRFKPWAPYHRYDPLFDAEFKRLWDEAYRAAPAPNESEPPGACYPPQRLIGS